jgi:hypothetical protein
MTFYVIRKQWTTHSAIRRRSLCSPKWYPIGASLSRCAAACSAELLRCRYVRAVASVLLLLGLLTAAANVWCVGSLNRRYLPQACAQAEAMLERKVCPAVVRAAP